VEQQLPPGARELDKIAAAHAAQDGEVGHRLWLDEQAGALLFLESAAAQLQVIPLRSADCTRVLADLTATMQHRLANPAKSYHTRHEADRDIGALVQLFRVQLARMRTEHSERAQLAQEIHTQVGRAGNEQQATRRKAFLGWYLEHAYGDDNDAYERAAQDLGSDADYRFVARTIMDWAWFRSRIRCRALPPLLDKVPDEWERRRGDRHWYYEFRTLGRQLTEQQKLELRAELPWANATDDTVVLDQWAQSFGHPIFGLADKLISQHFDAGLHFHQEGSRILWLRLPASLAPQIAPYQAGRDWAVHTTIFGEDLVLKLHRLEADGENSYEYYDPRPWLEELLPLREDLIRGDLRALEIAWRAANVTLAYTKSSKRSPMLDGLDEDELSPQLHALTRLLEETP
jgi:hypothetical protein